MHNDYELLYLIRGENDHIALRYMFRKYEKLIFKNVHLLQIKNYEHEDFIQEGRIMFYKAIKTFDEHKNKTFTRYFELILKRHYYYLKKKLPNYVFDEYLLNTYRCVYLEEDYDDFLDNCSTFEKDIFQLYFIENKSVDTIKNILSCRAKQVYNTIYRLKEKYKKYDII
jgi:RNA polymerase sporulation-specific sigma factor